MIKESTRVRARVKIIEDISYLESSREEKMDLYIPQDKVCDKPVVLQIHGGGWYAGDKATPRERNIGINLAEAGYVCASINYKLADAKGSFSDKLEQIWPTPLHDCMKALHFLRTNSKKYELDPGRIAVLGTSAGGQLAVMLGAVEEDSNLVLPLSINSNEFQAVRPQAIISLYGVHDFIRLSKTRNLELSVSEKKLCKSASPTSHISEKTPPILIVHGTNDQRVPINQAKALNNIALENGVDCKLHLVEDAEHSFHLEPEQEDLRPLVTEFLMRHL